MSGFRTLGMAVDSGFNKGHRLRGEFGLARASQTYAPVAKHSGNASG